MVGARAFAFGSFLLVPERQLLLQGESAVQIGGRALEILTALVERPGEIVSKSELIARAWPTTTVEACNLKVNVAALRRALGDDACATRYIATVTGRGYRFVAPVEARAAAGLPDVRYPANGAPARKVLVEIVGYGIMAEGALTLRFDGGPCRMTVVALDGD
jgi:DNA-binding winged helix-turn-helix (wHTH) protein